MQSKQVRNKELQYALQEESDDLEWSTAADDLEIIQQMSLQRFDNKERFSYDYE